MKLFSMMHCCMELRSRPILLLLPSCLLYSLSNCQGHLFNPENNKNNNFIIFMESIGIGLLQVSGYRYWPKFWYRYITTFISYQQI